MDHWTGIQEACGGVVLAVVLDTPSVLGKGPASLINLGKGGDWHAHLGGRFLPTYRTACLWMSASLHCPRPGPASSWERLVPCAGLHFSHCLLLQGDALVWLWSLASCALFGRFLTFHCSVLVCKILTENIWLAYVTSGFPCFPFSAEEVILESYVSQPSGLIPRKGSTEEEDPDSALSALPPPHLQRPSLCS